VPTVADLGRRAKAKYPGAYDDLSDEDLGRKVKLKYPGAYDDFVDAPQQPQATPGPTNGLGSYLMSSPALNYFLGPGGMANTRGPVGPGGPPGLGGIGGMGGIEESPGMAALTGPERQGIRMNALGNYATEIAMAGAPKVIGFGVNNKVTRFLGKQVIKRLVPAPVRAVGGALFDLAKQQATVGLPAVEEVAGRINPLGTFGAVPEEAAAAAPLADAAKRSMEKAMARSESALQRRLVRVREHIRELKPRAPKVAAPQTIASAERAAQKAASTSTTAPSDVVAQMQGTETLVRMGKSMGLSPTDILKRMRAAR
jgi:hypothetical protein